MDTHTNNYTDTYTHICIYLSLYLYSYLHLYLHLHLNLYLYIYLYNILMYMCKQFAHLNLTCFYQFDHVVCPPISFTFYIVCMWFMCYHQATMCLHHQVAPHYLFRSLVMSYKHGGLSHPHHTLS